MPSLARTTELPGAQLSLPLVGMEDSVALQTLPTFADCRRAAVHRWYPMVVGFSRTGVSTAIAESRLGPADLVLDPFVGSGTTCVVAKAMGIPSMGIEAHPFLALAARVKTAWDVAGGSRADLPRMAEDLANQARARSKSADAPPVPDFVRKLYPQDGALAELYSLRDVINESLQSEVAVREFMVLALARAALDATPSKIDGVYIAPTTHKRSHLPPLTAFTRRVGVMERDLRLVLRCCANAPARILEGDARDMPSAPTESVTLVFTSPPYLNNFDYAEMTRLELYLLGMATSWADISQRVRSRLVTSATTQVSRTKDGSPTPDPELPAAVRGTVQALSAQLAELRLTKAGRKDYDLTVIIYFNDMLKVLREIHRILRPGGVCRMIVGDSALYGVHVPTDDLLSTIAAQTGFGRVSSRALRRRGHRWVLPRRACVPLRESEITLWK
jgi:DNA modification methylase